MNIDEKSLFRIEKMIETISEIIQLMKDHPKWDKETILTFCESWKDRLSGLHSEIQKESINANI